MAYSLQRDVWSALGPLPPALRTFDARPILSVGVKGSSTRSHQHSETWQLLLAGAKAWWLAKPGTDLDKLLLGDPCEALRHVKGAAPAKRSGLGEEPWLCVQLPGEAVYFGDNFPHATCNLQSFVLGYGAQGLSSAWPALHRAAHQNDLDLLQRLLEEKPAEVNRRDASRFTPLMRGASAGHLAVLRRLVAAGARLEPMDAEGKSAAAMAAERGDLAALRFLADADAKLWRQERGPPEALHWAALSGHRPIMEFLLSRRASAHVQDEKGIQPIHYAALESDVATVAFLVEAGANVSAAGGKGELPLHWAAGVGHAAIVAYLLARRADGSGADLRQATALHFAAAQDRLQAAEVLVAAGAELQGPLAAARAQGHRRLVELLERGASRTRRREL
ncbi:unnamed protein product [Effrenium voratum]|nr:unnamed protein product [Effrenium voratum]